MKKTTILALSGAFLAASIAFAADAPKVNPFTEVLGPVPAAEMPAKAADAVKHAKSREKATTTVEVVKAALEINPAAAPAVVGAIAGSTPLMAPIAAATAAAEQPKQAALIAKAAAAAAPAQARKIVLAVCRAVPNEYRDVAVAVSQVVPGASKEILDAVVAAIPGLQPYVQQALAAYGGNNPSVPAVLDQAFRMAQANPAPVAPVSGAVATGTPGSMPAVAPGSATGLPSGPGTPFARGPAIGPPYVPLTIAPTNVTSGTSGVVPPGGRNYAAP
jgi:hypothetical protein